MVSSCHCLARRLRNERSLANGKTWKKNVRGFLRNLLYSFYRVCADQSKAYTFHAYGRTEGVAGVIISDADYPALVAHQLLSKVVDEFLSRYPRSSFANSNPTLDFPILKEYIVKYQDPQQADSIMKIQKELDETKIVLHKTIESVLERGEKIDSLVEKSDGLSAQSKMFYKYVSLATLDTERAKLTPLQASQDTKFLLRIDVIRVHSEDIAFNDLDHHAWNIGCLIVPGVLGYSFAYDNWGHRLIW